MCREKSLQFLRGGYCLETPTNYHGFFATARHDDGSDVEPFRFFEWIGSDRIEVRSYQSAEALLERMEQYAPVEEWQVSS